MAETAEKQNAGRKRRIKRSKVLLDLPENADPRPLSKLQVLRGQGKRGITTNDPPATFKVGASSVLSRVKMFLPEMEKADRQLKDLLRDDQSRESLDMENPKEGGPCIEMDMALIPMEDCSSSDEEETRRTGGHNHAGVTKGVSAESHSDSGESESELEKGSLSGTSHFPQSIPGKRRLIEEVA